MNGIHEVRGSIPLVSTNTQKKRAPTRCPFLFGVPKVLKTLLLAGSISHSSSQIAADSAKLLSCSVADFAIVAWARCVYRAKRRRRSIFNFPNPFDRMRSTNISALNFAGHFRPTWNCALTVVQDRPII